jgi:thiamine-monophosphate kinase
VRDRRPARRIVPEDARPRPLRRVASRSKDLPGEFELIARLSAGLRFSRRTVLGPGDDCAILGPARKAQLFTIDSMVEGVHFKIGWGTPEQIGARALAVNLSDVAAMGGAPTACVVNLAIPRTAAMPFVDKMNQGLRRAARAAGVDIVGGNITSAREFAITIALLGEAGAQVMRRDAARPGDDIFVTGTLGDAALGWRVLADEVRAQHRAREFLVNRYLAPTARLEAGARLVRLRPVPAAIDISDGLLQDLSHVLDASNVGAELDETKIPLSAAYRAVARGDRSHALTGGEDYELLFCARTSLTERELSRRLGVRVTRIGSIRRERGIELAHMKLPASAGYDQLRG